MPNQKVAPIERAWRVTPNSNVVRDYEQWIAKCDSHYKPFRTYDYEAASAYSTAKALENASIMESQSTGWTYQNMAILRDLPTRGDDNGNR